MAHQAARCMSIVDLPTDVLGCIVRHLQPKNWQCNRKLDDVAALRRVCRSLRLAVDLAVTHARVHGNASVAELVDIVRRSKGDMMCNRLLVMNMLSLSTFVQPHRQHSACRAPAHLASLHQALPLKFTSTVMLQPCRPAHREIAKSSSLCHNIDAGGAWTCATIA